MPPTSMWLYHTLNSILFWTTRALSSLKPSTLLHMGWFSLTLLIFIFIFLSLSLSSRLGSCLWATPLHHKTYAPTLSSFVLGHTPMTSLLFIISKKPRYIQAYHCLHEDFKITPPNLRLNDVGALALNESQRIK